MRRSLHVAVLDLISRVVASDVDGKLNFEHFAIFVPGDSSVEAKKWRLGVENHALSHRRRGGDGKGETNWGGRKNGMLSSYRESANTSQSTGQSVIVREAPLKTVADPLQPSILKLGV